MLERVKSELYVGCLLDEKECVKCKDVVINSLHAKIISSAILSSANLFIFQGFFSEDESEC